jgi:small subunit ribosomal protein S16
VAVKIKLKRLGKMRNPQYRIIVADARTKRDGRAIEEIGRYHPKEDPSLIEVNSERAQYWLGVGAQPTEPVAAILRVTGDWQKFKGEPGAEGTLRVAEPKVSKKAVFEAAAKESAEEPKAATTPRKKAAKAESKAEPKVESKGEPKAEVTDGAADAPVPDAAAIDAAAEPATEEPVAEEPAVEEPAVEEPVAEAAETSEATAEDAAAAEEAAEAPKADD